MKVCGLMIWNRQTALRRRIDLLFTFSLFHSGRRHTLNEMIHTHKVHTARHENKTVETLKKETDTKHGQLERLLNLNNQISIFLIHFRSENEEFFSNGWMNDMWKWISFWKKKAGNFFEIPPIEITSYQKRGGAQHTKESSFIDSSHKLCTIKM